VRCANAGSGDHAPCSHVPEAGKVVEDPSKPPACNDRDVFDDDRARLRLVDDAGVFAPETGSLAVNPCSFAGDTDVLAREAATHDVDEWKSGSCADIVVPRRVGPVLRQHSLAEWIALDLPDCARTSGPLQPEFEPADTREERSDRERHTFANVTPVCP